MNMLLTGFIIAFIIAFIVALYYQHMIKLAKPRNKVHAYVARDKNGSLWLYFNNDFYANHIDNIEPEFWFPFPKPPKE